MAIDKQARVGVLMGGFSSEREVSFTVPTGNFGDIFAGWCAKQMGVPIRKLVVATLGTGFGSAFIDDGVPVVERDDVPEEGCLWYLPYADGIADEYFTTRWFVKHYGGISGREVSGAKEVAEAARAGDTTAQGVFDQYGRPAGSPFLQSVLL